MKVECRIVTLRLGVLSMFIWLLIVDLYGQVGSVTLNYKNASFMEVIHAMKEQTGIKFLYNIDKVENRYCESLSLNKVPTAQAIPIVLSAFDLTYSEIEGVIVVEEQNQKEKTHQNKVVIGKVFDDKGKPLPGVTIRVKDSSVGVASDINGRFSMIISPLESSVLVFSFIGMKTKELKFTGQQPLNVILEREQIELEEVLVSVGYQRVNRRDMVGSYTTIQAKDVMMPSCTSIDQMLQGKIPGLVMMNTSSRVGRTPKINIRGTSTILGNTDPLWVVDGIIQSDPLPFDVSTSMTSDLSTLVGNQISWLNPADIETITILKDASATAVYGAKASNGVIVITTKKGNTDRQSVRYSLNMSMRARPHYGMFNLMNSAERIRFSREAYNVGVRYMNEPLPQIYTYEGLMYLLNERQISEKEFQKQIATLETTNTDWFDELTRNSLSHTHNLSLSGGSEKVTYSASLGYSNNKGVELNNDIEQISGRLNVNARILPNLKVDFNLSGNKSENKGYGPGINPMSYASSISRAIPAYHSDGSAVYYKEYHDYSLHSERSMLGFNILNEIEHSYAKNNATRFDIGLNLDWKIIENLNYQLVGGLSSNTNDSESYAGERTQYIARNYRGYDYGTALPNSELYKAAMLPFGGELFTANSRLMTYNLQHKLLYSQTFNANHRINAMLGVEIRSIDNKNGSNTVWGYVPERGERIMMPTPIKDLKPLGGRPVPMEWGILTSLYNGKWRNSSRTDNYFSFFMTFAYSLYNRYVFNINLRSDASNRFGQDVSKQYDPTYSFGVSWRMAEEKFMETLSHIIGQLNLRATWGIQGNVVNTLSPDLILSQQGVLPVYQQYHLTIHSLPNPYLKWERTKTWNLGLDVDLFNCVTMSVEYYGRASNAIINQDISEEYGKNTMQLNGGLINNHGIEFSMNITPFQRDNFAWTIGFNASKNWNKSDSEDAMSKSDILTKSNFLNGDPERLLKKGYPISGFWSYSFAGLSPEKGYPLFHKIDFEQSDANIDPTTFLTYSGEAEPYFSGGVNTRIRYKSITFGADFALLMGSKKRLPNPYATFNQGKIPDPYYNLSKVLNDRWKKPGDETNTIIPGLYNSITDEYNITLPDGKKESIYAMWAQSDAMVVDGSFFRCTQLSLAWNVSHRVLQRLKASSLSISANVNNVFVIGNKRFDGFDPELGDSVMPRVFSLGLSVGF